MKIMIKGIMKFFTAKLFFGKAFDLMKSNFLIASISLLLLVSIFYVPYEYFNYLESKGRFPDDIFGVNFLLVRPVILILVALFLIISTHHKIKKNDQDRIKIKKREEQEKLEKNRIAKEKIEELKSSTPIQLVEKTVSEPVVGAGAGTAIGALVGGSLGIAGKVAGTVVAVNGGWVLAPIGAAIGYLGIKAFNKKNKG
jgi:uncharacterized membrane protein